MEGRRLHVVEIGRRAREIDVAGAAGGQHREPDGHPQRDEQQHSTETEQRRGGAAHCVRRSKAKAVATHTIASRPVHRRDADTDQRLEPLATSRLVIDNEWIPDLEPELWDGDEVTADISESGRRLDELDLLPSPFPVEEYLSGRDLRHVMRLYSVGGLSYGNLSARKDDTRFWMSASGVDKSKLESIGRDILMVKDFDDERGVIVLSVPPGIEPRRVSVDAIEHWMIYQAHPDVGAILHVHAWMEGIAATDVNYPCGTQELAVAVADLVALEPDPAHAVIGLRNHGLTCTGDSLSEILDRVAPKVLRQVPMT